MSQENVEIVRKAVEVVSARQVPEDLLASDVQVQNVRTAVSDNIYVGHEGVGQWQRDFFGLMGEEARLEVERIIAVGEGVVVAVLRLVGRGRASDAPLELRWASAFWLRDGRITRTTNFASRREALEAAGLSE